MTVSLNMSSMKWKDLCLMFSIIFTPRCPCEKMSMPKNCQQNLKIMFGLISKKTLG